MTQQELLWLLFAHQDVKCVDFISKLIPNIARESFHVTDEQKAYLKSLKVKTRKS